MEILPNYFCTRIGLTFKESTGLLLSLYRTLQHPITLSGEPTLLVSSPPRRAIPRESCNSFTGSNTTPLITHKQEQ